jgi:hypothetical protein
MTIEKLNEKVRKLSKAKTQMWTKYYVGTISYDCYREYAHTIEHIQCSLLEKFDKEHYGTYELPNSCLPYYGVYSENDTIHISLKTLNACKNYVICYIGQDQSFPKTFGKVTLF